MNNAAQSEMPFYENIEQALTACVNALGGAKEVGRRLWSDKPIEESRTLVLNCCNPGRREKFDYTQVMYLFRESKAIGVYAPFFWYAGEMGYDAKPVSKAEEGDRLASVIERLSSDLAKVMKAAEQFKAQA